MTTIGEEKPLPFTTRALIAAIVVSRGEGGRIDEDTITSTLSTLHDRVPQTRRQFPKDATLVQLSSFVYCQCLRYTDCSSCFCIAPSDFSLLRQSVPPVALRLVEEHARA